MSDLRAFVAEGIRRHPRVAYQDLFGGEDDGGRLAVALPPLPSFRHEHVGALTIIDWDHKLPSQTLALRIFAYYSDEALEAGLEAYDDRIEQIAERDRYPEFDVPDFDGLPADEAYEIELSPARVIGRCRLTSAWRRTIAGAEAAAAVALAQQSPEFGNLIASTSARPSYLGELEAVSWTPPCESQHGRWTLDVWYLLAFDGRVGSGRSFLVDLIDHALVTTRDFSVRTG